MTHKKRTAPDPILYAVLPSQFWRCQSLKVIAPLGVMKHLFVSLADKYRSVESLIKPSSISKRITVKSIPDILLLGSPPEVFTLSKKEKYRALFIEIFSILISVIPALVVAAYLPKWLGT